MDHDGGGGGEGDHVTGGSGDKGGEGKDTDHDLVIDEQDGVGGASSPHMKKMITPPHSPLLGNGFSSNSEDGGGGKRRRLEQYDLTQQQQQQRPLSAEGSSNNVQEIKGEKEISVTE